jgi:murein DD-endopeptidase MepM/ murein hydrolase activator NlpD
MKKKTILLIPPRGTRIRSFRIRRSVAVLFFSIVLIGFAGYFIPFNSYTLDNIEQNQKRNLAEQNRKLLQRILSTLRLLNNLKDQVARLENKRDHMTDLVNMPAKPVRQQPPGFTANDLAPAALLHFVNERERRFETFADLGRKHNFFERIPVCRPLYGNPILGKAFGRCKDPFTGQVKFHYGVDFVAPQETPVIATATGTVTRVENDPIWGRRISIEHDNEFKTVYAHLGTVRTGKGKQVRRGEVIGTVGVSGLTTGPHVHYEIWHQSKPTDPENYFFPQLDSIPGTIVSLSN